MLSHNSMMSGISTLFIIYFWIAVNGFAIFRFVSSFQTTTSLKLTIPSTIEEEAPADSFVFSVADKTNLERIKTPGELTTMRYELIDIDDRHYFKINSVSGVVTTAKPIDREILCKNGAKKCCSKMSAVASLSNNQFVAKSSLTTEKNKDLCILVISLTASQPKKTSELHLIQASIEILDINDNEPTFSRRRTTIPVKENVPVNSVLEFFHVRDPDSEKNSFQNVLFENDPSYQGTVDSGKPLSDGTRVFEVSRVHNGINLILKEVLDREVADEYRMIIKAVDGGQPSKTGTCFLTIKVIDVNDNSPIWAKDQIFSVSLPEDQVPNSVILRLSATDEDAGENGRVTYELDKTGSQGYSDSQDKFYIDHTTGEIKLSSYLDYERKSLYKVHVLARDSGLPTARSVTTTVTVKVTDLNDNAPHIQMVYFTPEKRYYVMENLEHDFKVGSIYVSDPDEGEGGKVFCDLDPLSDFKLEPIKETLKKGYTIMTKRMFDREKQSRYTVTLTCRDNGYPPKVTKQRVIIEIKDENDNSPVFNKSLFVVSVPENSPINTYIAQLDVSDADSGENGRVKLSLDDQARRMFRLDEDTGKLYSAVIFDREVEPKYQFMVTAQDYALPSKLRKSASCSVKVIIKDTNDHAPVFSEIYFFRVPEHSKPGTFVGHVRAEDKDADNNSKIFYRIINKPNSPFKINQSTGEITVHSSNLDREQQSTHEVTVQAEDSGVPRKSGVTTVHIELVDINDHAPRFIFPSREFNYLNVSCQEDAHQLITNIQANDSDSDENSKILYSLVDPNTGSHSRFSPPVTSASPDAPNGDSIQNSQSLNERPEDKPQFEIDIQSGRLYLLKKFEHCSSAPYEIRVVIKATDQGTPPKSATIVLIIQVLDSPGYNGQPGHVSTLSSHWSAIVGLIVATIILIGLLCIVLGLMRNRFIQEEKQYNDEQHQQEILKMNAKPSSPEIVGPPRDLYTAPNYYYTCDAEVYDDFMDAKTGHGGKGSSRFYLTEGHISNHTIASDRGIDSSSGATRGVPTAYYQTLHPISHASTTRPPPCDVIAYPSELYSRGDLNNTSGNNNSKYTTKTLSPLSSGKKSTSSFFDNREVDGVSLNRKLSMNNPTTPRDQHGLTTSRMRTRSGENLLSESGGKEMQERGGEMGALSMSQLQRVGGVNPGTQTLKSNPYCTVSFV